MASRTREKLIDTAKQLFMRKGVENTTISDIANACDKGRRTIYTYFKNKREIYKAVVERESDNMVGTLREIAAKDAPARERLLEFCESRLRYNRGGSSYSAGLRSLVDSDFRRMEKVRKLAYEKEEAILRGILADGIASGEFDAERCRLLEHFLGRLLQAADLVWLEEEDKKVDSQLVPSIASFITLGVSK